MFNDKSNQNILLGVSSLLFCILFWLVAGIDIVLNFIYISLNRWGFLTLKNTYSINKLLPKYIKQPHQLK